MKATGTSLKTHMAQEVTTVCTCWKLTRRDNLVVLGFTDCAIDLAIGGVTYKASTGYQATAIESSEGFSVDNLETHGMLDSTAITEADLLAGLWDFAEVLIFQVNYLDLSMGVENMRRGRIGEVQTGRIAFTAELRGMMQAFAQDIGRLFGAACDADLGDTRCGINLATFSGGTVSGSVTSVTDRRQFIDTARIGAAANAYTGGKLTWSAGANSGFGMEVRTFTTATGFIGLVLPMPFAIAPGDTYSMTMGCDKSFGTCQSVFANPTRFRGFPHLPGQDRMVAGT